MIYQDRLGTNIGKALKKQTTVFLGTSTTHGGRHRQSPHPHLRRWCLAPAWRQRQVVAVRWRSPYAEPPKSATGRAGS